MEVVGENLLKRVEEGMGREKVDTLGTDNSLKKFRYEVEEIEG